MAAERTPAAPRILGLTGPIACGKTTVGDLLLELGALERIDADQVVHALMGPGMPATRSIVKAFGPDVLQPDGAVNRTRLAAIVFADETALRRLEAIIHPAVRQSIRSRLKELQGQRGVVVVDAVRLLQSDLLPLCDAVWVVRCDPEMQLDRLLGNRGMTREAAEGRLAAQPSFSHDRISAFIENSGSLAELRQEVQQRWQQQMRDWRLDQV